VYYQIDERGIPYLVVSVLAILLIHDTYFYWIHRFMHLPYVYRWVHRTHHQSVNPTPWAAMAFHPVEAVLEAAIIPLVAVLFPVHPLAIGIFLLVMMVYNVYGHLGFEWYGRGFPASCFGRWINTSVSHNQHHQHVTGNYGLYFLFWDRWMGTLRKDYDNDFGRVAGKSTLI
jgi:sterol desaturase/sphingolipid hydroxylase (fatty acid hydroxylase superfamily)